MVITAVVADVHYAHVFALDVFQFRPLDACFHVFT
jgi:hypothetical protein